MIKYPRTLAMTGKSRRDLQQKRGAGRCEAPWDAPKAPMSRGAEMPCRYRGKSAEPLQAPNSGGTTDRSSP